MNQTRTLEAKNLVRTFDGKSAVEGVSITLSRGEVLGFLGPNGAGKSTTMRMLTGNLRPESGQVEICGIDLLKSPVQAKRLLGYLPEHPPLYREMKVDEYLQFAAKLHRADPGSVESAKERCGLVDAGRKLIGTLSRGYQQRVGIAQAILHDPEVVILDEPTSGLDPNQIREIRALIREIGDRKSVILSTHILSEVESICDRVEILHKGRLVYEGSLDSRPACIEAAFRNPPEKAELESIEGVMSVEALCADSFRLNHERERDPTESVVKAAAEKGWGLSRIGPGKAMLEEVFAELTREDK
ncbi:MAG: ATP-binding cassette domain-containing protein [Burkholderiales bacterium]|nr:ATP-binding cassette domain-containing protein [Burkholderiales bacterium]